MDYHNDPLIKKINAQPSLIDYISVLLLLFGICIGIVIGSGIHDWLFHFGSR